MADLLKPNAANVGRRRTIVRMGGVMATAHGTRLRSIVKEGGGGSDALESNRHAHVKLENSYKLRPEDQEKFQARRVEKVMQDVLEERLGKMTYESATCQLLAKELATEIQKRVKDFRWQRYKIVSQVTLGQQTHQSLQVASRCVWDQTLDSYTSVTYNNKSIFAVAQCYGIYYE